MGFFSDIKGDIAHAKDARDTIIALPAQRIDTLVADPVSDERRHRTDYAGTVWYGGRPQPDALVRVGATIRLATPFWLPDSHAYDPALAAGAQIQASAAAQSVWISSVGGECQIFEVGAAFGQDPQHGGVLRVFIALSASASLPLGVAYRVTVVCAPEALRRPAT